MELVLGCPAVVPRLSDQCPTAITAARRTMHTDLGIYLLAKGGIVLGDILILWLAADVTFQLFPSGDT